jgi:hypothetical protein
MPASNAEFDAFGVAVKALYPDSTPATRRDLSIAAAKSLGIELGKATGAELNTILDKMAATARPEKGAAE